MATVPQSQTSLIMKLVSDNEGTEKGLLPKSILVVVNNALGLLSIDPTFCSIHGVLFGILKKIDV